MNHQQNLNRLGAAVSNGDLHTSWNSNAVMDAMQASWFTCSVTEEDFIDNCQPNLIPSSLTGSMCSNFTTDDTCVKNETVNQQYIELPFDATDSTDTNVGINDTVHNPTDDYISRPDSPKSKLSLSMHDISTIPSFPLTSKSSHFSTSTIQSQSMTTDASLPKSKDSGFPRSVSCLSLYSNKSYAHVQSKVKEYIRQIKEENEGRKAHNNSSNHIEQEPAFVNEESVSVKKLIPIIDKLKDELDDKDKIIIKLQENYDTLLTRYAAAEHRIDHFRVTASTSGNTTPIILPKSECKRSRTMTDANFLLIPELQGILNKSQSDFDGSFSKKHLPGLSKSSSKVLNPITKFYSSSVRLDKLGSQQSIMKADEESLGCSPLKGEHSKVSDRHTSSSTLHDRSDLETRNRIHKNSTSVVKELSPERLNNQLAENPFIKVQRWQESLPSFELIEPSSYGSLGTSKSDSPPSGSFPTNESTDQSFNVSSSSHRDSSVNEGNSSTKNLSSYLLLRSISQPNYAQGDFDSRQSLHQTSQQVDTTDAHSIKRSHSLKVVEEPMCRLKQGAHPLPPVLSGRHRNLGITENSHVSRKKLIGQKARLVLFEYLKNSPCNSNLYNICKSPKVLERLPNFQIDKDNKQESSSLDGSCDDRDSSLVHCLDEMNQCAQNLKGKSEAIIQVLAKQLKD